ncbi:MAG: bifunctional UDP-sugar hydrolase/5'-nucleotidase [Spirochaetales bacterium]|nr:bifunctional UDP-sugar hydrolase/5'-nucleotidase [Spirochaetales bacterium]
MNRFTKTLSTLVLVVMVALSLIGCQSTSAPVEVVPEIVVPEAVPVAEVPVVEEPAPVVAPEPEPVVEEPAKAEPVYGSVSVYGYPISYKVEAGKATITYPSFVTDEEVVGFLSYFAQKAGAIVEGTVFEITAPGTVVVTFDEAATYADVEAVGTYAFNCLFEYVNMLFAPVAEEPAPVVEEPAPVVEAPVETKYSGTVYAYGFPVRYEVELGKVYIDYPSVITKEDAQGFFGYVANKYGEYAKAVTFKFVDDSAVELYFSKDASFEDIQVVAGALANDLVDYVTSLFAALEQVAEAPAVEEVAPVVEEPAPVAEEPAVVYPYGVQPIVKNTQGDTEFDLFVVHTNDVHARIVPADGGMGYAKLATLVKAGRAITDNILVLDAGDVTHGTNLANMFNGQTVGQILAMIGYDAVAPGNHDFNYGADNLKALAAMSEAIGGPKVLSANILTEDGYNVFQPYQLYDFNGFKVCVIGLTTPDTKTKAHPKYTEGLTFWSDEVLAVAQYAIDLAHEYADYVIVLGHFGLDEDGSSGITSEYVCKNIKGIDLFVDGHSHTTLPEGYKVGDTLIVQTGEYLKNVGLVQLHVKDGKVTATYPMLISASDVLDPANSELAKSVGITEVPDDPEVSAYIAAVEEELNAKLSVVIADVPVFLDGARANVRTKQTNLSKLICEAMTAETGADFTITNGGGIRASINPGKVTLGDVNNVLPFTNIVAVCEITGAQVYEALEYGYRMIPETNGGFTQTDLKVVYSKFSPAGSRIKRVVLPNGNVIDKNATYTVATNDFLAAGGDGFTMFGKIVQEGRQLNEVFADYLAKVYPVK